MYDYSWNIWTKLKASTVERVYKENISFYYRFPGKAQYNLLPLLWFWNFMIFLHLASLKDRALSNSLYVVLSRNFCFFLILSKSSITSRHFVFEESSIILATVTHFWLRGILQSA